MPKADVHADLLGGFMQAKLAIAAFGLTVGCAYAQAQDSRPDFSGMWSNPPVTLEEASCRFYCTDAGIDHLFSLLDDPRNDTRPLPQLIDEARNHERDKYLRPRLTSAALETYPLNPTDDRSFLYCEPWGFARQIFAPHQLEITQYDDRIEMRYGEWDARRTVHLDAREPETNQPATLLGLSVGRYEGETLVVETSRVGANSTFWGWAHSGRLRAVERYSRSDDGERLELVVSIDDPWGLKEPLILKKTWGWAPAEEIFPYVDCEPAEGSEQ